MVYGVGGVTLADGEEGRISNLELAGQLLSDWPPLHLCPFACFLLGISIELVMQYNAWKVL